MIGWELCVLIGAGECGYRKLLGVIFKTAQRKRATTTIKKKREDCADEGVKHHWEVLDSADSRDKDLMALAELI